MDLKEGDEVLDIRNPGRIYSKRELNQTKVNENVIQNIFNLPKKFYDFIISLMSYLDFRVTQITNIFVALSEIFTSVLSRQKRFIVSNFFWGRGEVYKIFFRVGMVVAFIAWFYTAMWSPQSEASTYKADTELITMRKDFEVEMGYSVIPTDKDRPRDSVQEYTVQGGDTISTIAEKFDISIETIKWANGLANDYIRPGQKLKILSVTGVLHKVQSGDTLVKLAEKYQASEQGIADVNWLDPPFTLTKDTELLIPEGKMPKPKPVVATKPVAAPSSGSAVNVPINTTTVAGAKFLMPVTGWISRGYLRYHRGMDIANRNYPPVVAAESGRVIYSGWDTSGYGFTILLDHGNGYRTRYAHASKLYVKTGDYVNRGQTIMQMGSTGRSTGPHLHFEVIKSGVKVDPAPYLR